MKKLFLFSTKLYNFWTVLPLAVLLAVSIHLNGNATGLMKLYPLIILSAAGIVFVILFFLRGIVLSYDDARCVGIFSKKDRAIFEKDYSLVITDENKVGVSTDKAATFILEATENDTFKIRTESGAYLALSDKGDNLITADNGEEFKIARYSQNRYKFYVSDGRALIGSNDPQKTPLITLGEPSWSPNRTLRITQA